MISRNIENAINFISSFSDNRCPADPYFICKELGIKINDKFPLQKNGYLICQNGKKIILIDSRITNPHRRKFIVAHELGHFMLHRDQLYSCDNISDITCQNVNTREQEKEADSFASELLVPHHELKKRIPLGPITFSCIYDIANLFDISVTHAAIQTVMASNSECEVLICYEEQKLKWYKSANKYTYPRMIPRQCPIQLNCSNPKIHINGIWNELYHGTVCQEVFHPYGENYLVLLSGTRK